MTHPGQLLKQKKLYAGKELGQNFLSNPDTARMIIRKTGISKKTNVMEIGSGLGALTIPIAQTANHVIAVEKDSRLISLLQNELNNKKLKNINIINGDILKLDIKKFAQDNKLVAIGNLPYNISSQILFKLIETRSCFEKAFLMFQKELAERIIAPPGGRNYSRLSAVVQYAADISVVAKIGPSSFFPKPEIDSTVLKFKFFKTDLNQEQETMLFNVIKAAFSKRRKSLKNSMSGDLFDKKLILNVLKSSGIDSTRRAETLTTDEFKHLALAIMEKT